MDEEEAEKSLVFTTEIKVTRRRRFKSGGYLSFNRYNYNGLVTIGR